MLVSGAMVNAGQVCAAQTRILVPEARHEEIVDAMSQATRALRVGDPRSPATDIGPLISQWQRERVERYIRLGIDEGARLVAGGRPSGHQHRLVRGADAVRAEAGLAAAAQPY